jgi:hypothetical protein
MLLAGAGVSYVIEAAPAQAATQLPCDIYDAAGTPCVAAYSTTRALYAAYDGNLYQIKRASDGTYLNIAVASLGGYANAAPQVSFCAGTTCTITTIYDQSPDGNNLPISGDGTGDVGANAMALPVDVNGNQVYGVKVLDTSSGPVGYRNFDASGVATGSEPEGIYEVTSTAAYNSTCCFDFGSAETGIRDDGDGTMNAIEFGSACWFGGCTGPGPWVEADLEQGMYSTGTGPNNANNPGITYPYVTAWEKENGTSNFTLKYGSAAGGSLTATYSGALPNGYDPMKIENAIDLGTGGGNDHGDTGEFFEGAMVSGFPSDATENAVQAELATVGYPTSLPTSPGFPSGYGSLTISSDSLCLDNYGATSNAGAIIDQLTCNGQTNQQFQFVPTSGGFGELQVESSGQDVTAIAEGSSSATAQGVPDIVQEPVSGSSAAQWLPEGQLDGSFQFENEASGLCLDVYGAGSNTGQQLDQWPCKGGTGTNQDFAPSATGPSGGTTTTTPATTTTTTTTTTTKPTTTTTGPSTTTTTVASGYPSGYHTLVVSSDSLCLDGYGNSSNAGAVIDQWTCNGQTNQDFQFVPTSGGYGELQVESSGQDVTAIAEGSSSATAQGVPDIVQEPVSGSTASQWLPEEQSDGSYQLENDNSGLCLDVYGAGSNTGQQLDQWPCKNTTGTNQDFKA